MILRIQSTPRLIHRQIPRSISNKYDKAQRGGGAHNKLPGAPRSKWCKVECICFEGMNSLNNLIVWLKSSSQREDSSYYEQYHYENSKTFTRE